MSKKIDFAIINFWWCDDHGAILTAYALQTFLKKEGYSSELLKSGRNFDENRREGGISKIFEKQYMNTSSNVYSTYNDLFEANNNKIINERYVGFITGSDQVFRPEYVPDSWYLTFVKGKGKIAAAASFGIDKFICDDMERRERIAESLKSFDYISVREDSGVDICKNEFDIDAFHMLDPIFLIDKQEYENILKKSKMSKNADFIFCYIRDMNQRIQKMINNFKTKYNLDVIMCHEKMTIEDFLYAVANCKYVITDSYHGMCFSIIFNRNFLCIRNTMRGKARFESIQKQLGLNEDSFVDENEEIEEIENIPCMDYSNVNAKLKYLSDQGAGWLKHALNDTYRIYR